MDRAVNAVSTTKEVMHLRGLALLILGGAFWLLVAVFSVSADGGPHIAAVNNGSGGLTADNCAGCHRAHTAPATDLLKVSASNLCLACHNGDGATTDVVDGYQFVPSAGAAGLAGGHGSTVLGALRGGGFSYALIDSGNGARKTYLSQTQRVDLSGLSGSDTFTISGNFGSAFTTGAITFYGTGNGSTTLTAAMTSTDTTLSVSSPSGFLTAGGDTILIDSEQMIVTAGQTTKTWTVTRGANGTTAAAHASGKTVYRVDQVLINPFSEGTPKNYTQAGATAKAIANALLGTQSSPAYSFSWTAGIVGVTGTSATNAKQPNFSVSYSDPLGFGDGTFRVGLQNDLTFVTTAWPLMTADSSVWGSTRTFSFPSDPALREMPRVGVLTAANKQPVTSKHLGSGIVWGNGDVSAGVGVTLAGSDTLDCAACHNPHGNNAYRILRTDPGQEWTDGDTPTFDNGDDVLVPDITAVNPVTTVRNYTVLPKDSATDAGAFAATQGDYVRRKIPAWNYTNLTADFDVNGWNPNRPARSDTDQTTIAAANVTTWCIACHTRYNGIPTVDYDTGSSSPSSLTSPDLTDVHFTYRHGTSSTGCLMCHVSHGSNAFMTGVYSANYTTPSGTADFVYRLATSPGVFNGAVVFSQPSGTDGVDFRTEGDSRLLKANNRGTCTLCHDPTETILGGQTVGPTPSPIAP